MPPLPKAKFFIAAGASPRPTAHSIITQIGRENKFSAEICILRTVGDAGPYNEYPYEKEPKPRFFRSFSVYQYCDVRYFLRINLHKKNAVHRMTIMSAMVWMELPTEDSILSCSHSSLAMFWVSTSSIW